ncbi:MAG: ABC transporter ATP-binding protein [Eubacteriales bacterium]
MIKVNNVSYTYKKSNTKAINNISFQIEKGEIFGFLGPSGAGKSTLQKVLIKLLDGYTGEILIFDKDMTTLKSDYYENIGVGFELPNHYEKLSGYENLKFFQSFYKNQNVNIDELLKKLGLFEDKDKLVEAYSKGMKMRLSFARALLNDADFLFFDEPTSGLDPLNAKIIQDYILALKEKGKTIFITTHSMQVADHLCDTVSFIVDGEIVEMDSPKALKLKYGTRTVDLEYFDKNEAIQNASFLLDGLGENLAFLELIKEHKIQTIHSKETTLEDVFIQVTGRRLN